MINHLKYFCMKKIILAIALLLAIGSSVSAQTTTTTTTTTRTRYYYYPSSNVYFNPTTNEYWYYDDGTTNWTLVKALPATITLGKTPRYTVYYDGADVWKDNAAHKQKYKVKKNGELKAKKPKDGKE